MKKEMLINVLQPEECRIAILEDGVLEELYVERTSHESYVGNIYKGRIVNLEPSIQAAFVDFGVGRNGFLHISDVEPQYFRQGGFDPGESMGFGRMADIDVGDEVTPLEIPVTTTMIVAGAIASRDFMPVHHDREYAQAQGAPDIFMNILSDTGYCSRFLTDWAGPDARIRKLAIRLGVPVHPGHTPAAQFAG